MPSNEVMKDALYKVLLYFPHLAGRFTVDSQGRTCIALNNADIRVTETYLHTSISENLPLEPPKEVSHLLPSSIEGIEELLQIQLNRYACGGLVIGLTAHHRVYDGQSMSGFFVAWARLVRGLDIDPLPYLDRHKILVPRNPPIIEFDHHSIEFRKTTNNLPDTPIPSSPIEVSSTSFSNEFINKLKVKVLNENQTVFRGYSTFECLLAHVWKKVTQARELQLDEWTQVRVAVNGRTRMKPPVPMEFVGNLVLWAYPKLRVKEVLHGSYGHVAKAIHDAVAKIDHKYFQSFIDFGEKASQFEEELEATSQLEIGNTMCPNLEVDSWMRFQFHELDFGGGGPCAFYPPNIPVEGLLIFMPSCQEGGGVDVVMSLLPQHVQLFKQSSHSLE
ncbi:hypothetical protein Scep_012921 [Stephania cephalantha]|uniref:Uncharacterized protein n=1 Tax=Stephania cephalantha TaxID=152367 RepID=A0AAP0JG02_9MAGN